MLAIVLYGVNHEHRRFVLGTEVKKNRVFCEEESENASVAVIYIYYYCCWCSFGAAKTSPRTSSIV